MSKRLQGIMLEKSLSDSLYHELINRLILKKKQCYIKKKNKILTKSNLCQMKGWDTVSNLQLGYKKIGFEEWTVS